MTPDSLFWEALVRDVAVWAVASVFIERALYQVFDTNLWQRFDDWLDVAMGDHVDPKPWISAAVSVWLVFQVEFDIFQTLFAYPEPLTGTLVMTGLAVAGGTTGAFKAFARIRQIRDAAAARKINGNA